MPFGHQRSPTANVSESTVSRGCTNHGVELCLLPGGEGSVLTHLWQVIVWFCLHCINAVMICEMVSKILQVSLTINLRLCIQLVVAKLGSLGQYAGGNDGSVAVERAWSCMRVHYCLTKIAVPPRLCPGSLVRNTGLQMPLINAQRSCRPHADDVRSYTEIIPTTSRARNLKLIRSVPRVSL
ncbi:hypothetical protein GOBAR_DD04418 [Gossypium barbadense]|nr:hypothetical protein GOBAR_DD04418 [Gossypium barbadense]